MTSIAIIHFVALEGRETLDNLQQLIIKTEFKKMERHRMDLLPMCTAHVLADGSKVPIQHFKSILQTESICYNQTAGLNR